MSKPISYEDALEDCLNTVQSGGDIRTAVARYPRHEAALRDDVRVAYALRRAAFTVVPPEGAESRASLHLANALREARAESQPARRSSSTFGWLTGALRPIAVMGVAVVALVAFGLGSGTVSTPFGGASSAEASTVEGVVVENKDGTLTLETSQGLTRVDLNQKPTIQDHTLKLLTAADLEAGQVVRIEAKKTPQGALIARQIDRKPVNAIQDWCTDNGDACHEVAPRLEAAVGQCRPGDQQCLRVQQNITQVQDGLRELSKRILELKTKCEGREGSACRQLLQVCKDHALVCADLKIRPAGIIPQNSGPAGQNPGQPQQQRPAQPPQQRPNGGPAPRP